MWRWTKIFLGGWLLVVWSACGQEVVPTNDWQRLRLRGQVQQLEEWTYPNYAAFTQAQHSARQKNWFTEQGLLTKNAFYQNAHRVVWTYYHYVPDSVWIRRTLQINGGQEQTQNFWLYELNNRGQQEILTFLLSDSSISHKIRVEFNPQHVPSKLVYSEKKYPQNVPCEVHKRYDEQQRVQEEWHYVYDNATQQCHPIPTKSFFRYNKQGDVEREHLTYFNGQKEQYSYQYQYDSVGNWTNCMHYKGDAVVEVTKRALLYYHNKS